jgi:acyl carrier protein|tara:strand:- start:350 stop:580 length:231 start_codon:yes stop_codon:yes gene_type:complete
MKNKKIIQEVLEDCDLSQVSISDNLDDLGFDSLSSINLMSVMSNDYDIEIDPDEIENLKNIEDLDNFISNKLNSSA